MKDDVAQPVDMAVALVQHTRSLEQPKLRDWQVLVEATGYGALNEELYSLVSRHVCDGVLKHWATLDVLPTWLEEAAEKGRAGYVTAWRENE